MSTTNDNITKLIPLSDRNFTEYKAFFENTDDLNEDQKFLIRRLIQKEDRRMRSFDPVYFHNAAFLVLADSPFMRHVVYCGNEVAEGIRASCNHPMWCPRCANRQAYKLQEKYLLTAHRHPLQDLTVTFQNPISFEGPNHANIRQVYEAFADAARAMVESGSWNGVYMKHEVAIDQYLPLKVVVHSHLIVHADPITEMQTHQFSEEFARKVRDIIVEYHSGLNYLAKPIDGQEGLFYRLNYVNKPVNPWPKYQAAWQNQIATGQRQAHELNTEVYGLVHGLEDMLRDLHKTHAFGTFHGANPNYIGLSETDQENRSEETEQVVRNIRARYNRRQARARRVNEARQIEVVMLGLDPDDARAN